MTGRAQLDEQLTRITGEFHAMQDLVAQQVALLGRTAGGPGGSFRQPTVSALDRLVDRASERLEDDALRLLARQAPVAHDLKLTLLVLQSIPDLERAGDYAKHAEAHLKRLSPATAAAFERQGGPEALAVLSRMAATLRDAAPDMRAASAAEVCAHDDRLDELYDLALQDLMGAPADAAPLTEAMTLLQCWRALERLGDHLVNVATRIVRLSGTRPAA